MTTTPSNAKGTSIPDTKVVRSPTPVSHASIETASTLPPNTEDKTEGSENVAFDYELDPETDRRLLRKTDLFLCPLMMLVYAVQYLDKSTNATAAVMGLREDLKMQGDDFAWSGTAFYLGFLIFEFPSVYLLQHFPLVKTVSVFIVLWGVVLCLHATPNYPGFIALRAILGMLESAVTPCFVILTSQWYKREEQFLRTSIWLGANGLGLMVGSFVAYGLAVNQHLSIAGWRLIFIITGVITIFVGIIVLFQGMVSE